jgi:branched-chain amino acid transport system substrate-binding protein
VGTRGVLIAGCIALAVGLPDARSADTIRIAFIGGLSGPSALQGEEQLKGFFAAAELLNSQGGALGGHKFEIVPFDNKANPQESLIVLRQAMDQDIRYVASTLSSVANAISEAVAKHNARNADRPVLFLNFNALDPALTESKCNFWHFRFEVNSDTQVEVLTEAMAKQRSVRKVYLINQDYAYGQSVSRATREMLARKRPDIQLVGDDLIPLLKVKDFAPYVSKIRASGADAVLTGNWGNDLSLLIKASKEAKLPATYYALLGAFFGTPSAIGSAGADRVRTVASWHVNAADTVWEQRLSLYAKRYRSTSDMAYLPPFRVLNMLATAMDKAGSQDPAKVARALEGARYSGPSGDSWMRADDHQIIAPVYLMSFVKAGTRASRRRRHRVRMAYR